MQSLGELSIRVGGLSGGWHLLFGDWAGASEDLLPLDVYRCPGCKRVEFFDLENRLSKEDKTERKSVAAEERPAPVPDDTCLRCGRPLPATVSTCASCGWTFGEQANANEEV
jgi:hypothetical protein